MRLSLFVPLLAACFATAALAADTLVADTHHATIARDGKRIHVKWTSVVPVDFATLTGRLSDVAKTPALMTGEDVTIRVVERKSERAARLRMDRETPLFFPDVWLLVHATVATERDRTRIRWRRLDGTAEEWERTWTFHPHGAGTRVECETRALLPFDVPDFLARNRLKSQLAEDMSSLERLAGAKPRSPTP